MAKTRRSYVGRVAVVGAAEGQADAPNTGEPGTRALDDDQRPRFQDDWRRRYAERGPYEEYASAYAHGYALARQESWRDRPWEDVELHARASWEERRPGTWDRFKDVIRRGWEWLTLPEDDQSSMRRGP